VITRYEGLFAPYLRVEGRGRLRHRQNIDAATYTFVAASARVYIALGNSARWEQDESSRSVAGCEMSQRTASRNIALPTADCLAGLSLTPRDARAAC
jgi:hypothetical protein